MKFLAFDLLCLKFPHVSKNSFADNASFQNACMQIAFLLSFSIRFRKTDKNNKDRLAALVDNWFISSHFN